MPQCIAQDEVHIWLAFPHAISDPKLLAAYQSLMNAGEREKMQRFRFEKDRHTCLVTRALARTTLSAYTNVRPDAWVFEENAYGRPDLAAPQCDLPLAFNLSHTHGLITCAVTLTREIGVDVEYLQRSGETVSIAERFFSSLEVQSLHRLPTAEQHERFFRYWTLKEAYIKARGLGLALPLDQFSFHLDEDGPIRISFGPGIDDDPNSWQFAFSTPTPMHALAVGVRKPSAREMRIQIMETVPLRDGSSDTHMI